MSTTPKPRTNTTGVTDVNDVKVDSITLSDGVIEYNGKPLILKLSEWTTTIVNNNLKILNVTIDNTGKMYQILKQVDKLIKDEVPQGFNQIKTIKNYRDKDDVQHFSCKPAYRFADVYDEKQQKKTTDDLFTSNCIEGRYVFKFRKAYKNLKYYGTQLSIVQMQYRHSPKTDSIFKVCLFD
jgi:hypothetical protein